MTFTGKASGKVSGKVCGRHSLITLRLDLESFKLIYSVVMILLVL
jgi:hypothetical protein